MLQEKFIIINKCVRFKRSLFQFYRLYLHSEALNIVRDKIVIISVILSVKIDANANLKNKLWGMVYFYQTLIIFFSLYRVYIIFYIKFQNYKNNTKLPGYSC